MIEEDYVTRDLHNLNLITKLMVLLSQISLYLAIAAIAEKIKMLISAEEMSLLDGKFAS